MPRIPCVIRRCKQGQLGLETLDYWGYITGMSHYLVTGGCGFIGSHLTEALIAEGHQVSIIDDLSTGKTNNVPLGVRIHIGDVADPAKLAKAMVGIDGIFHLAAVASVQKSNEDWPGTHRTNCSGTVQVLNAAREHRLPVVYASSAATYGDNPDMPITEAAITRPLTPYGADKLSSEQHAYVARHSFKIPTMGFRFFNVYGPRQDPNSPYSGVISIFAKKLANKLPITVHGDGQQSRDFIFVGDVVKGLMLGMQALNEKGLDTPPVMNLCTGQETSVMRLAEIMMLLWQANVEVQLSDARTGDIKRSVGNNQLFTSTLGHSNFTPLKEGLGILKSSLA